MKASSREGLHITDDSNLSLNPGTGEESSQAELASKSDRDLAETSPSWNQAQQPMALFYNNVYGITLLGNRDDGWDGARSSYHRVVDHVARFAEGDTEFERCKKETFKLELERMQAIDCSALPVLDLSFEMDGQTLKLRLASSPDPASSAERHGAASSSMPRRS